MAGSSPADTARATVLAGIPYVDATARMLKRRFVCCNFCVLSLNIKSQKLFVLSLN
jgi:hypothetical protein